MNDAQKCLVLDIETMPMEVRVWKLGEQHVNMNQIVKDWSVAAWAAKWLNAPTSQIMYQDTSCNKDVRYDRNILDKLWKLLDEANILITQNGKNFDARMLNARFIEYGMKPPSPYEHLDTYKIADSVAEFTSHKLEYLTDKLNTKYKKLKHKKYPGNSLWDQCLAGNLDAWKEMKRYNIHDVLATEELYLNLQAWVPKSAPRVFVTPNSLTCGVCGKNALSGNGIRFTKKRKYQRLRCTACGHHSIGDLIK